MSDFRVFVSVFVFWGLFCSGCRSSCCLRKPNVSHQRAFSPWEKWGPRLSEAECLIFKAEREQVGENHLLVTETRGCSCHYDKTSVALGCSSNVDRDIQTHSRLRLLATDSRKPTGSFWNTARNTAEWRPRPTPADPRSFVRWAT